MRWISETETVVKRILPYLRRRGYDDGSDLEYETGAAFADRYGKGYVDILVTCGKPRPQFLVEAKRLSRSIGQKDEKQALEYGQAFKVPFVVVTNGMEMRCLNVANGQAIRWDGTLRGLVPPKQSSRRHGIPAAAQRGDRCPTVQRRRTSFQARAPPSAAQRPVCEVPHDDPEYREAGGDCLRRLLEDSLPEAAGGKGRP